MLRFSANRILILFLAALFVSSGHGSASADTTPVASWKVGDGFHIRLRAYVLGSSEQKYDMHVIVTGSEKRGRFDCWRLEFIPIAAPPTLGGGYRVWIDKANGMVRMIVSRKAQKSPSLPKPDGLPILPAFLPGYPLEVLPLLGLAPYHSGDGSASLRLTNRREANATLWEATWSKGEKEQFVIKQKWVDGDVWWSEYELLRNGQKELFGSIVPKKRSPMPAPLNSASPRPGNSLPPRSQPIHGTPPATGGLRADPRLQTRISAEFHQRPLQELLDLLSSKTNVTLTMTEPLAADAPEVGGLSLTGVPAWEVMEQISHDFVVDGRWDKTDAGYQLSATRAVPARRPPARRGSSVLFWWLIGLPITILLVTWLARLYQRQQLPPPESPVSKPDTQ